MAVKNESRDIAIGVKVFTRTNHLQGLLESIQHPEITKVYVADDGEITDEKTKIYDREYKFDLVVYDLPYDAGLGKGRSRIVEDLSEEFLLILDTDHRLPEDITPLIELLETKTELGGVSGLLHERNRITGHCHDLYERNRLLIRDVKGRKPVHNIAGHPFVRYDFIPNAALFKRACLKDYNWDPNYVIGKEHLDFYVGHTKHSEWEFGVCPTVIFEHSPGGPTEYLQNREDYMKLQASRSYFLDKWGYTDIVLGYTEWEQPDHYCPTWREISRDIYKKLLLASPPRAQQFMMNVRNNVRRYQRKPPI